MTAVEIGFINLFFLGSADRANFKVLIALAELFAAAMGTALLVQGIWGLVELMRKEMKLVFLIPAFCHGCNQQFIGCDLRANY